MSRSTEKKKKNQMEAINAIWLYLNITFCSVYKVLKLSLVGIGSKSEEKLLV